MKCFCVYVPEETIPESILNKLHGFHYQAFLHVPEIGKPGKPHIHIVVKLPFMYTRDSVALRFEISARWVSFVSNYNATIAYCMEPQLGWKCIPMET